MTRKNGYKGLFQVLLLILSTGCVVAQFPEQKGDSDAFMQVFVGKWKGEHMNADGQLERAWMLERFSDGTYTIIFFHHTKSGVFSSKAKGRWWINGDRFFETTGKNEKTVDEYTFQIISDDAIRFSSVTKDYVFTDKRVAVFIEPELI
jgi:hypothetical protein